ncbi:hypothetical protein PMIT1320_01841 [Prochlorococcus marinus str. MIT 1320]|nr:hypothetical protein PMIT1320_01841 [Prochlorococcus marinus str. MIT 1320]
MVIKILIITKNLAWYHLPKTAGTTTDKLFEASGLPLLWNDPQDSPVKHLPPHEHPFGFDLPLNDVRKLINFRRLPSWLLSNYHHKLTKMGLQLSDEQMRNGFFWRDRQKQWLPADWWLERFSVSDDWSFLRVEHLKDDFLKILSDYQPIGLRSHLRVRLVSALNKNTYSRQISRWFTENDLRRVYSANPIWASFESRIYGNLLNI